MRTSAPVTILDRSEIEATGSASIGELLRELPVATASATDTASRGNGGTATVALRGLGAVNTLVLINGRRVLSNNDGGTVDLNSIPFEAVERVEVLQDGASAIYGSDAIAGVVNIIMRRDFDGLMVRAATASPAAATCPIASSAPPSVASATTAASCSTPPGARPTATSSPTGRSAATRTGARSAAATSAIPCRSSRWCRDCRASAPRSDLLRDGVTQAATVDDFRAFSFPDTGDPLTSGNDGINYWLYETSASDIASTTPVHRRL